LKRERQFREPESVVTPSPTVGSDVVVVVIVDHND